MRWLRRAMYGPFLAQLVVTRRCNLSCGYCNEFDEVSDPVPTEELKRRIDKLAELGTLAVEFTGGEPLMHPDLPELIQYATDLGFVKRMMITNAYLLSRDLVDRLNESGLTDMQISLDGAKPNDTTVKVLRPLRPKLAHVAEGARFRVVLSAVVGAAPSEEVAEVVEFAEQHGMRPRVLLLHGEDGQLNLEPEERELFHDLQRRLGTKWNEARDYRSQLLEHGRAPFKCRSGSRYLYVDEFGVISWCSQTRGAWSKKLLDYTWDDLREQFYTHKSCNEHCTVGCARTNSKVDEWRRQPLQRDQVHLPVMGS